MVPRWVPQGVMEVEISGYDEGVIVGVSSNVLLKVLYRVYRGGISCRVVDVDDEARSIGFL